MSLILSSASSVLSLMCKQLEGSILCLVDKYAMQSRITLDSLSINSPDFCCYPASKVGIISSSSSPSMSCVLGKPSSGPSTSSGSSTWQSKTSFTSSSKSSSSSSLSWPRELKWALLTLPCPKSCELCVYSDRTICYDWVSAASFVSLDKLVYCWCEGLCFSDRSSFAVSSSMIC